MTKHKIKTDGLAVCYKCGDELIAPADGEAYWCIECSQEDDLTTATNSRRCDEDE